MSKRPKGYHSKEEEGDNASKSGKGTGPPVDGPPVDGTQAGTTQTESSLSTVTVQPSDDPTGFSGDLANDIDPADNMPTLTDQKPGQSLHDTGVKGSGSTVQGASAGGNMSGNGTRPKTSGQVLSTINQDLVCDRRVKETRQSYHDIGICVRAFDDKVRGLLRKVAACRILEMGKAADLPRTTATLASFDQWSTLTDEKLTHKQALDTIKQKVQEKGTGTKRNWHRITLFSAFVEMIHRFYKLKDSQKLSVKLTELVFKVPQSCKERPMTKGLQNLDSSTDEIFAFLEQQKDNKVVYDSLIKVLIEHFLRDMNYSVLELNDTLAKSDKEWKPHEDISCPDMDDNQKSEHKKCSSDSCSIRYTRENELKGNWDWVDEMRYIRNNVVKAFYRFKDKGQQERFIHLYREFIEGVNFTEIFPLTAGDKWKECMALIETHDSVQGEVDRLTDEVDKLTDEVRWVRDDLDSMTDDVDALNEENWRLEEMHSFGGG